jgi:hypothetical protein
MVRKEGALVIGPDNLFTIHKEQLAKLTVRHAIPAIYQRRCWWPDELWNH